eukprot:498759_1
MASEEQLADVIQEQDNKAVEEQPTNDAVELTELVSEVKDDSVEEQPNNDTVQKEVVDKERTNDAVQVSSEHDHDHEHTEELHDEPKDKKKSKHVLQYSNHSHGDVPCFDPDCEDTALAYKDHSDQPTTEKWARRFSGWIVITIVYVIGVSTVLGRFYAFPDPKATSVPSDQFSEDRSTIYLDYLTKDIGERHTIAERLLAADYIYEQMVKIKEASAYSDRVYTNISSGLMGYVSHVRGLNYTIHNVWLYVNLTGEADSEYILVSGHYDTQPNTVGCNDDTVSIAAILELASVYSSFTTKELKRYNYNVLFVAIDGEEQGNFPGARGLFWAKHRPPMINPNTTVGTPRIIWNIESTGRGKHMAYRSNSDYIIREYMQCTPEPMATSIASSVLALASISLGTDALIYGHHSHTLGFASLHDHWVYHTPLDNCDDAYVEGSLQLLGDNSMACFEHFLTKSKGDIPVDGFNQMGTLQNHMYWNNTVRNADWIYSPHYSRGGLMTNNMLFYSILYSSGVAIDLDTVTTYQFVCCIIFWLINVAVLHSNAKMGKTNPIITIRAKFFRFNAIVQSLFLANFLVCVFLCLGLTALMTAIRPTGGENVSCANTKSGGFGVCFETHWRGVATMYTFTMIILVVLITYTFQFIIAKINLTHEEPYHFREMEKIVFLNNNVFACVITFIMTAIGQVSFDIYDFVLMLHLSYAAFWWCIFCTAGSIMLFVLFYTGLIKGRSLEETRDVKEWVVNVSYVLFYAFPALISFEFVCTMIPIFLGFENFIPVALVGAIAGMMVPNIVMPYVSLLQRRIMQNYKYIFGVFGFTFVLSFILCCTLKSTPMELVVGYE